MIIISLDKSIKYGKEHRKQYIGAKASDITCRNHGSCEWCHRNRIYKTEKRKLSIEQKLKDYIKEIKL